MSHGPILITKTSALSLSFLFSDTEKGGKVWCDQVVRKKEENRREGKRRKRSKIVSINGSQEVGLSVLPTFIWEYQNYTNPMQKWQLWLALYILVYVFCVAHFRQVLLRRLRRTTGIDGRDRFEHTLFTHRRWQPVLRTSVLGYCRQTQQLNHEHELSVVKATRKIMSSVKKFIPPLEPFFKPYFTGQEKYRSISRQYLRKADGVLIMYDVTSEISFLHVRYWVDCVKVRNDFLFPYEVSFFLMWLARLSRYWVAEGDGTEWKGDHCLMAIHIINCCRVHTL